MRRQLSLILTLSAWLLATGCHWDLVQTFGWGRMIASYSKTMPLKEAIRLTFTADNLCSVCTFVQDAKQGGADAPVPVGQIDHKMVLVFQPAADVVLASPGSESWNLPKSRVVSLGRSSPPTPPPRGA